MRRWFATSILISTLLPHLNISSANAQQLDSDKRYQALYSKPAVVRICNGYIAKVEWQGKSRNYSKISCGSGFFISSDGFIVTNAHVTEFTNKQGGASEDEIKSSIQEKIDQEFSNSSESSSNKPFLSKFDYIHHVILPVCGEPLPFVIKKFGKPNGEGEDISVIKIEIDNAPILRIGDSSQVQLQDQVVLIGYPGAADNMPNCKSFHEASFSQGAVSAIKQDENGNNVIQLDATASPGNSGGPVLNEQGEVIGLATSVGLNKNQPVYGITFMVGC